MNSAEINQRIAVANAEIKKLHDERQANLGRKQTFEQQIEASLKAYNESYGTSITIADIDKELERITAIKEAELNNVEAILTDIRNKDFASAEAKLGKTTTEAQVTEAQAAEAPIFSTPQSEVAPTVKTPIAEAPQTVTTPPVVETPQATVAPVSEMPTVPTPPVVEAPQTVTPPVVEAPTMPSAPTAVVPPTVEAPVAPPTVAPPMPNIEAPSGVSTQPIEPAKPANPITGFGDILNGTAFQP